MEILSSQFGHMPMFAGLQIYEWVKNNPDVDEEAMVNLFFGVRDAAYTIIEKKAQHSTVSL